MMTLRSKAEKTKDLLNTILPDNTWSEWVFVSNRPKVRIKIRDGSNRGFVVAKVDAGDEKAYDSLAKLLMSKFIRWTVNSEDWKEKVYWKDRLQNERI